MHGATIKISVRNSYLKFTFLIAFYTLSMEYGDTVDKFRVKMAL
jgi:hypothetical protein